MNHLIKHLNAPLAAALCLTTSAATHAQLFNLSGYGSTSVGGQQLPFTLTGSYSDTSAMGEWTLTMPLTGTIEPTALVMEQDWEMNNATGVIESITPTGCTFFDMLFCESMNDYLATHDWTTQTPPLEAGNFYFEAFSGYYNDYIDLTVTPVPLPAGIWLFGAAVLGLAGLKRQSNRI